MAYTVIDKPSDYFNTIIYTGNNNQSQTISGVGFQPDWIWIKNSDNTEWHHLMDVFRGDNKFIHSNTNDAESTGNRGNGHNALAFTSDGFSITNATEEDGDLNFGSRPYPTWCWKAGTAFTNDASETGIGSIDSVGSVNTDAGFSIISWTAGSGVAGIAHGLGGVPDLIISKDRDAASGWIIGSHLINNWDSYLNLSNSSTATSDVRMYHPSGEARPSSTIFFQDHAAIGSSGEKMIAYCFKNVKGYQKIGNFIGNGNANGSYTHLGFSPAFLFLKNTADSGGNWQLFDNKRDPNNVANHRLFPSLTNAENSDADNNIDFLSNGFKMRTSNGDTNSNGVTFIYYAVASSPFVTSTGIPATAR